MFKHLGFKGEVEFRRQKKFGDIKVMWARFSAGDSEQDCPLDLLASGRPQRNVLFTHWRRRCIASAPLDEDEEQEQEQEQKQEQKQEQEQKKEQEQAKGQEQEQAKEQQQGDKAVGGGAQRGAR